MYLVMSLHKNLGIASHPFNKTIEVPLAWSPGMIGACPVFETREDAERYACGDEVVEIRALQGVMKDD